MIQGYKSGRSGAHSGKLDLASLAHVNTISAP